MPVPPERLKELTGGTAGHRASLTRPHPELQEVAIRRRGSFGCTDARAGKGDDHDEKIPLCRIEYPGGGDRALAVSGPATGEHADAVPKTGSRTGTPGDACGTAALIRLTGYEQQP